jgi:hypothetical protein
MARLPRMLKIAAWLLAAAVLLAGCANSDDGAPKMGKKPLTLADVARSGNEKNPGRLGIEENGVAVPYLVVSADYGGNCLLLRERLLDGQRRFNPNGRFSAFYEGSEIDQYLNGEFLSALEEGAASSISATPIVITALESLGVCGAETKTIERKAFLLSYAEVGGIKSETTNAEGRGLSFFGGNASRTASHMSGTADSWWTRTPNTWYDNVVCAVSEDGVIGMGGVGGGDGDYVNGVRPAFCLSPDIEVLPGDDFYLPLFPDNA